MERLNEASIAYPVDQLHTVEIFYTNIIVIQNNTEWMQLSMLSTTYLRPIFWLDYCNNGQKIQDILWVRLIPQSSYPCLVQATTMQKFLKFPGRVH